MPPQSAPTPTDEMTALLQEVEQAQPIQSPHHSGRFVSGRRPIGLHSILPVMVVGALLVSGGITAVVFTRASTAPQIVPQQAPAPSALPAGAAPAAPKMQISPDLDSDGVISHRDAMLFVGYWSSGDQTADIDGSGKVDLADFHLLVQTWM